MKNQGFIRNGEFLVLFVEHSSCIEEKIQQKNDSVYLKKQGKHGIVTM